MITEDYCTYDISKLLKEKGFDGQTHGNMSEIPCMCYITHQTAMKWLRERHNLCISLYAAAYRFGFTIDKCDTGSNICNDDVLDEELLTYEEAVEAALKYVLENLI